MTLQDIVNQTQYAARKATLGAVVGISLVGAPEISHAYGQSPPLSTPPSPSTMNNPPIPIRSPPALSFPLTAPHRVISVNNGLISQQFLKGNTVMGHDFLGNGLNTGFVTNEKEAAYIDSLSKTEEEAPFSLSEILGLSPTEKLFYFQKFQQEQYQRFAHSSQVIAELTEKLSSPSLNRLQEHYRAEQQHIPPGSSVYKAKYRPGYYVHYPQMHRIYYVERKDSHSIEGL